ncbi:hypothetical protein Taro_006180, partial [Colocasia esculenta]|nr:hypothetical protein [Colocasia esculenta]
TGRRNKGGARKSLGEVEEKAAGGEGGDEDDASAGRDGSSFRDLRRIRGVIWGPSPIRRRVGGRWLNPGKRGGAEGAVVVEGGRGRRGGRGGRRGGVQQQALAAEAGGRVHGGLLGVRYEDLPPAAPAGCHRRRLHHLARGEGGYLFGLPVGFVADSIGATIGATAAFLLGRTIGRPYVLSKLRDYPKFQAVAIAIQRSGFKIVLLLRLVPLLPFNMLNYLLSVTPIGLGEYMLASWLGMMPITLALVYVGTTLKDLSDVTHGWSDFSTTRWVIIIAGLIVSAVLMVCVTKVAKASLEKALAENSDTDGLLSSSQLPVSDPSPDLQQPLIIKIDPPCDTHEK